jgi:hypothetical protein
MHTEEGPPGTTNVEALSQSTRSDRLLRKFLRAQPKEVLVDWMIAQGQADARLRDDLLSRMRADHLTMDEARRALQRVLEDPDEPDDRGASLGPALRTLYEDGGGEPLLSLLRAFIGVRKGLDPAFELSELAFEIASWVMADLQWTASQRLDWYGETYLATEYDWENYVEGLEPSREDWARRAEALLERLQQHEVVWNDRLVEHTAHTLCKAGRADEAYALHLRTSPVTGHWWKAVFILRDQPFEWQLAFARPLVEAIRRWNGPESIQEFSLETAEQYLGAALGRPTQKT